MKTLRHRSAFLLLPVLTGIAQSQVHPAIKPDAKEAHENLSRRSRIGARELRLPGRLHNDELTASNHRLENELARLEHREEPNKTADLDFFLIQMDKVSVQLANWFAQVWSSNSYLGLRGKLSEAEAGFDDLDAKCHPEGSDEKGPVEQSITEAKENCEALQQLWQTVRKFAITVSVPPPTVFKHDPALTSKGEAWLLQDMRQLRLDSTARRPKEITKILTDGDQMLIGLDKQVWLQEISAADIRRFNERYPAQRLEETDDLVKIISKLREKVATLQAETRARLVQMR